MKIRFCISLLATMLITLTCTACSANRTQKLEQAEAEIIALEHAGFAADEVSYLHTDYDIDDGIPKYEVQFHQGYQEYEYDIHAETGEILSVNKDN